MGFISHEPTNRTTIVFHHINKFLSHQGIDTFLLLRHESVLIISHTSAYKSPRARPRINSVEDCFFEIFTYALRIFSCFISRSTFLCELNLLFSPCYQLRPTFVFVHATTAFFQSACYKGDRDTAQDNVRDSHAT